MGLQSDIQQENANNTNRWRSESMSRVTVTLCDCCRKEITNKPDEPNLLMTVIFYKKQVGHYCHLCAVPIIKAMNEVIKEKNKGS